jgi:hypothetical protein
VSASGVLSQGKEGITPEQFGMASTATEQTKQTKHEISKRSWEKYS